MQPVAPPSTLCTAPGRGRPARSRALRQSLRRDLGRSRVVLGLVWQLGGLGLLSCAREPPPASAPTGAAVPMGAPRPLASTAAALFKIDAPVAWPLLCFDAVSKRLVGGVECGKLLPQALTIRGERGTPMDLWRSGTLPCTTGPGTAGAGTAGAGTAPVELPLYRLVTSAEPDARAGTWGQAAPPRLFLPPTVPEQLVQTPGQRRGALRSSQALLPAAEQRRLSDLRIDAVWIVDLDLDGVRERIDEMTLLDRAGVPIGSGIFVTPGRGLEARPLRLLANPAQRHRMIAAVDLDQDGRTELWIAREPVQLSGAGRADVAQRIDEVGRYVGGGMVTIDQVSCRPP